MPERGGEGERERGEGEGGGERGRGKGGEEVEGMASRVDIDEYLGSAVP